MDRAYSNWTHLWCDGLEPEERFMQACMAEPERVAQGWAPIWRYLELGRYGEQLEDLFRWFPRTQVHILRYRDLVDEHDRSLDGICEFLGVDTGLVSEAPLENVSTWVAPTPVNQALQGMTASCFTSGTPLVMTMFRADVLKLLPQQMVNGKPTGKFLVNDEALVYGGIAALVGAVVWSSWLRGSTSREFCSPCEQLPLLQDKEPK